jgi:predicted NodU family carbamoyl transferase
MKYIIGINEGQNSSLVLYDFTDKEIVFAAQEERFNKIKEYIGFPELTLNYVVQKYRKEIESGNIEFFINKDYANDVSVSPYSDKITEAIDRLRNPIKQMNDQDRLKALKYIQNFTKISDLCEITI